jgi:hypothetical protein
MDTSWGAARRVVTALVATAGLALAGTAAPIQPSAAAPIQPSAADRVRSGRPSIDCTGPGCPKPGALPRALSAYLLVGNEAEPIGTGTGFALVDISTDWTRLCYVLNVVGLNSNPTAAHIHHGAAGVNGPVVVPLTAPVGGVAAGCATVEPTLAADIATHSGDYYVNVHTGLAPAGAIRGQLTVAPLCTIGCVRPGA